MSSTNRSHVSASAAIWTSATKFKFTSGSKAMFDDISQSSFAWDGLTTFGKSGGFISSTWTNINTFYTFGYSFAKTRGVICHELGHVLGLGEDYSHADAVMAPKTALRSATEPSADDIRYANSAY